MKNYKKLILLLLLVSSTSLLAKDYKGAEYRTHDSFLYGRFEVSMKPSNRIGVVSSFFTYHEITSTADWNEIDIENIGRYDDMMQFNTITSGQANHVRNEPIKFNQYEEFHTYAFEWTPDYIAWFIDGAEVFRQTDEHVQTVNKAQKIMMNIWNPEYEDWVGVWDDSSLPTFSYYDWVSYAAYTPDTGNTGTNNNFTSLWRDDFDTYDSMRWGKATHTWQGNKCDFVKENAVIKDGKLILCLTDDSNLGYQDNAKPVLLWAQAYSNGNIELKFSEEVDATSSETLSNYLIPGGSIKSSKLSKDFTTVTLETELVDPTIAVNIIVMNINDIWGNTISTIAKTIIPVSFPEFPLSINVGGVAKLGYLTDQEWNQNLHYGYLEGQSKAWPSNTQIFNTDEDEIYLNDKEGTKKYLIKVPNNQYDVTLMFAEKYFDQSGKRIFDIIIEDSSVEMNVDVFFEVGKDAAFNITKTITVKDELLEIILSPEVDKVALSGIKVATNPASVSSNNNGMENIKLTQNYPNPFNLSTVIKYTIQKKNNIKLIIYDMLGNEIITLVDQIKEAGDYEVVFNQNIIGKKLASGIYFCQLQTENFNETKKMILIK